jgi:hypothetical protein
MSGDDLYDGAGLYDTGAFYNGPIGNLFTPQGIIELDLGGFISGARLDDVTTAKLDSAVLGPTTPTFAEDISIYVREASTHRGAQRELERIEAGTASIVLDNRDGRFTPLNPASPYYPNILPMRRIRIRAMSLSDGIGWGE